MGGDRMKRRLAVLLALTLTFATLSPAGAIAAEADQAQTIEYVSVEEESAGEEAEPEQEELVPESEESAQEATTVTIAEEETPLVATPKESRAASSWWWMLLLAAGLGITIEEYVRIKAYKGSENLFCKLKIFILCF